MTGSTRRLRLVAAGTTLFAAAVIVTPSVAEPARSRYEAQVYVARTGVADCASEGGVCFGLNGDEIAVAIGVVDDLGHAPVSAVYSLLDAGGNPLATGSFCNTASVPVPTGSQRLAVAVKAADPVGCVASGVAVAVTGKVRAVFDLDARDPGPLVEAEPADCTQPVPARASVAGVTDGGRTVDLDVLVVLDRVARARGEEIISKAAQAYAPLGIRLVPKFREVELHWTSADDMIGQTQGLFGGYVPNAFDVVYTITSHQRMNVVGQAECIGGVRFRDRAFAIGRDVPDRQVVFVGPVRGDMITDYAAKNAAHEIGHLMGAHHHYANCVEGRCTVMQSPNPSGLSLRFSSVNGAIVRGHAVAYADD